MHNTYVTSSYTLRTRWSVPYSSTDYTICSNERYPFAYSSSRTACCCSCCANSVYRAPISPSYCYNLYGYGQSSLIQRSACRNVCLGGFDRSYCSRVPICDVDRRCFVDKGCNFREKSGGGKRGRLRKVMVFEERDDSYDLGDVDEADILLSLLSGDVDEDCLYVKRDRKRLVKKPIVEKRENGEDCVYVKRDSKRLVKKPMVEKRENGGSCSECGSRKKRVDSGVLENDVSRGYKSVVPSSRKGVDRRRVDIIQKEEDGEASLRKENQKTRITEEKRKAILKKVNQRVEEKQEQETLLRKENWKVRAREEEREELLRREEQRPKVTRAESSCSSYYSVSSTGDYASDNDIELRDERYAGESSSGYKDNTRRNEIVYQEAGKQDQRHEGYRVDHQVGLAKKSTAQESHMSSCVMESDFRKKSEKKLTDVSVEEIESRKGTMQKESELSMAHGSGYGSSYMKLDDRKLKSTGSAHLDVAKQLHRQTGEEVSRQSETKMKYKQLVEVPDDDRRAAKTSYGSKRMYSDKDDISATVISSSQGAATEHRTSVGLTIRDDEYHKDAQKVSDVSNIVDVDLRRTSVSQKEFESSDKKKEDYSTNVLSSVYDAKRQQHHDRVSVQSQQSTKKESTSSSKRQTDRKLVKQEENVNLVYGSSHYDQVSGQSQQLTKEESTSFSKRQSDRNLVKQEENVNLVYGSSQGLEERHLQSHANYIRTEDSRNESNKLTSISISHSGNSSAIIVDEQNKTSSAALVRPPYSRLGASGAEHDESTSGSTMENVTDESLQFGLSKLHGRHLERSTAMHHEEYGRVQSDAGDLMFKAHEDALGSAARFQKSSAHYVGEFVDQVRHETMSSEFQKEKKTFETKLMHEEKDDQKRLSQNSSGESSSKEHDRRLSSQGPVIKGPSDEVWKVDDPLVPEPSAAELQEDGENASNVIVKRTGRSLWNVISDVFRLQWSPRSESHSASGKTGGRSSPNQSTSSETWFSGHEAEENKETTEERGNKSITQEQKTHSQLKESSSSSTLEGYLEHVGTNAPSSSVFSESKVPSAEETSRSNLAGPSNAAPVVVQSSVSVPALRLQRSPFVRSNLETGEENVSSSSMSEQLNNESMEQSELVIIQGEPKGRKLQRKDQMVKDQFDEWEEAYKLEAEQRKLDEMFMREALLEARKAAECWEVPVGAVLVHKGKIIARGWNLVEEMRDSTAHAEMICIREASKILRTWRLSETTLYVTLEPCPMCAGAILQARIDCVVWGAPNKLLGADGSWIRLFPSGDGGNVLEQNDKPAAPVHPFHPKIAIRRNVLASECADAMQQFFQLRRKKKEKKPSPPSPPSCLPIPHHQPKFLTKMQGAFHIMFHS